MEITLRIAESNTLIPSLTTYAPHIGGTLKEQKSQWGKVHETLHQTPQRHRILRCADANGKIGKLKREEEENRSE